MMILIYIFGFAPIVVGLLHSYMSVRKTSTSTERPWPRLALGSFDSSPEDPWVPHRKPTESHRQNKETTETSASQPHNGSFNLPKENMISLTDAFSYSSKDLVSLTDPNPSLVPQSVYLRHEVPYQYVTTTTTEGTVTPTRRTRKKQRKDAQELLVSIPKIFADMAFTGHYGRITIPRNKIR